MCPLRKRRCQGTAKFREETSKKAAPRSWTAVAAAQNLCALRAGCKPLLLRCSNSQKGCGSAATTSADREPNCLTSWGLPATHPAALTSPSCPDQGGQQLLLQAAPAPAVKAVIDRRWRSIARRTILPTATRFQHMDNAADDPPVVYAPSPRTITRQQWINRRPLRVAHPKQVRHWLPSCLRC